MWFWTLINKQNCALCILLCLTSFLKNSPLLLCRAKTCTFSLRRSAPLYARITIYFCILLPTDAWITSSVCRLLIRWLWAALQTPPRLERTAACQEMLLFGCRRWCEECSSEQSCRSQTRRRPGACVIASCNWNRRLSPLVHLSYPARTLIMIFICISKITNNIDWSLSRILLALWMFVLFREIFVQFFCPYLHRVVYFFFIDE